MADDSPTATYTRFACIGAGFSGIGLGATLKRRYNITDIQLFEREADLGGTWWANRYPGCACDVPSGLYSFSFECNPDWTRCLPTSPELFAYLRRVAVKYDLVSKTSFHTRVERAEWREECARWRLTARDVRTGAGRTHECQFLFSGTGVLVDPRLLDPADVPGVETFRGPVIHSARWPREGVDLKGKDVVIFGNGCTGAQIVPAIAPEVRNLTQFVHSKHWVIPPIDRETQRAMQLIMRYVPGAMLLQRFLIFAGAENELRMFYNSWNGNRFRKRREAQVRQYMQRTAPKKYWDALIPDFPLGCKRRIFDPGYLESLHRDNVTLTNEKALEIMPEGVRTKDGVVKADVIILATGFKTNGFLQGIEVRGRGGVTPDEHWKNFGGPGAYNCTAMSEFPNFFMLLGPNSATGHTSTVIAIENSINFSLKLIEPILKGEAAILEVNRDAEREDCEAVQRGLSKTVFNAGCGNWYSRAGEYGEKVWNASTYPWTQGYAWYRSLFPTWNHWQYRGPIAKKAGRSRVIPLLLIIMTLLSAFSLQTTSVLSKFAQAKGILANSIPGLSINDI